MLTPDEMGATARRLNVRVGAVVVAVHDAVSDGVPPADVLRHVERTKAARPADRRPWPVAHNGWWDR